MSNISIKLKIILLSCALLTLSPFPLFYHCPLTHSLTHSLIHSLTHSLIHSFYLSLSLSLSLSLTLSLCLLGRSFPSLLSIFHPFVNFFYSCICLSLFIFFHLFHISPAPLSLTEYLHISLIIYLILSPELSSMSFNLIIHPLISLCLCS